MSWLRHDDDMLDHPKWIRALRDGGAEALLIWWRLCAWSSRRLTDGVIPVDMIGEVARVERSKSKLRALQVLVDVELCTRRDDGALVINDYLERNPSKAEVLEERERRARAQRNRRLAKPVTGHAPISHPPPCPSPVPSRPVPSPSLSNESESTRTPKVDRPPDVPGLEVVHPGPLPQSKRERAECDALTDKGNPRHEFTPGWSPGKSNQARGHELGLTDDEIWARWETCKDRYFPAPFQSDVKQFNRELAFAAQDKTTARFKLSKADRAAFEMPGRERRHG